MTNNGTSTIANFGSLVYDSGGDLSTGKHRIGTSATEIELLDDLPPPLGAGITTAENGLSKQARVSDTQQQSDNYHTLSRNRGQPTANIVYQDENDSKLNSAVDKLLEKYAPDAAPQNFINTSASRRPVSQGNVSTAQNPPIPSTFQTNAPSSSTTSNSYSTIIRPKTTQLSQSQTAINNNNRQSSTNSRPTSSYDSFQHTVPQYQQQQQQQSKPAVSIKTKNGHTTQVVPGKLYTLDDDPLHLLYDRQNPKASARQQQQPPASFQSTFQPSTTTQHIQDPFATLFSNTSQRHAQQSTTSATDTDANGLHPFDLGNLIKRVQQDYLREIQPFVSSVKFVEKDKEFGQSLNDIDFTTPITVRKGFTRQADDILRRSFGGQERQQKSMNPYHLEDNYSYEDNDDDINELRSPTRQRPLQKFDSKQSFTSVTSTSTHGSDYDEPNSAVYPRKRQANVHDQGTSPPPRLKQANNQSQVPRPVAATAASSSKPIPRDESDEDDMTTNGRVVIKPATRITSDQAIRSPSESDESESADEYTATYNENENSTTPRVNPSQPLGTLATSTHVVQPGNAGAARDQINTGKQSQLRSEDIRPTPPTIRPGTNSQNPVKKIDSERSDSGESRSDQVSESDDEEQSTAAPTNPVPPSSTNRSNVQQNSSTTPGGRPTAAPQTDARSAAAATTTTKPPTTARTTVETNARQAAAAGNPSTTTARTTVETNARQAATAGNPSTTTARTTVENNARQAAATGNPSATTARTTVENNARQAAATGNPSATTARATVENNARQAAATGNPPSTTARTTVENNARQAAGAAAPNSNLHFVPPDARGATAAAPATQPSSTVAQTGSTRLFQSDTDPKGKRSIKDAPAAVGNKLKSLFRRK